MDIKIFDKYNIRARLSVYIIIIAPVILTVYATYDPIRSFSFSAIFIAILTAFSNYLFALQRYLQKGKKFKNTAVEFLSLSDTHLGTRTKQRYYKKLSSIDNDFEIFNNPSDSEEFKSACFSAVHWLRNNTRDNKLVQEENMLCGFYKNLMSLKAMGIIFTAIAVMILLIPSIPINVKDFVTNANNIGIIAVNAFFLLFWIIGVNKKIYTVLTEKYAYALLGALDTIDLG